MGRSHAYDCNQRDYFGHGCKASPDNYLANARAQFLGLTGYRSYSGIVSENAAGGPNEVPRWMNSSGHRKNIMHPDHTCAGVGISPSSRYGIITMLECSSR
jgi:uncharacterized protein YkwD